MQGYDSERKLGSAVQLPHARRSEISFSGRMETTSAFFFSEIINHAKVTKRGYCYLQVVVVHKVITKVVYKVVSKVVNKVVYKEVGKVVYKVICKVVYKVVYKIVNKVRNKVVNKEVSKVNGKVATK